MAEIKNHRDLEAWQVAMDAVLKTYEVTSDFPKAETYGLTGQMRRAAVSVPSNIAEGHARFGRAGLNHIGIALGSLAELDTQLAVAIRLAFVTLDRADSLQKLIESSRRLLYGLRRARRQRLGISVGAPACLVLIAVRFLG
jgi:four helix bundle protein